MSSRALQHLQDHLSNPSTSGSASCLLTHVLVYLTYVTNQPAGLIIADEGTLFCDAEAGCGGRICFDCAEGESDYCYECSRCTGSLGDCCRCGSASPWAGLYPGGQGYPGQGYWY